ncbi:MAG: hypothetical protein JRF04_04265 [Deltaproteobacteria bacterium]|nr:hypothetical protein [Deltaproteobacteria bacterium]
MFTSRNFRNSLTIAAALSDVAGTLRLLAIFVFVLSTLLSCTTITTPPARKNKLTIIGTGDLQGKLDSVPSSIRITESGEKTDLTGGISRIATVFR